MDSRQSQRVIHTDESACEFCPPPVRLEWFNKPLASDGDLAIAVPSLGSFVPGYLLVLPVKHATASCRITKDAKERFATFTATLSARLASIYSKPVTMFEHGACSLKQEPRSACINHAHIHLVPGDYNLMTEAPAEFLKYDSLYDFLQEEQEDPYLMLKDPEGDLISFEDRPAPQFFRRIVAQRLEIPDRWDYAAFPFFENVRQTYRDFGIGMP